MLKQEEWSPTACLSFGFALTAVVFFLAATWFLIDEGSRALRREGLDFFLKADWFFRVDHYHAASMIYGSFVVTGIAVTLAAPLGIGAAAFISEYLTGTLRIVVKSCMELLAGIPSVVYGLIGVLYLRPFIFEVLSPFQPESGDNLLTAGILVGIMILPTVVSLSDDAFRSVSQHERESARSLGLTKFESFVHAVFPKAFAGLMAAILLALGRAAGETIAVYLVVGRADNRLANPWYSLRPFIEAGQTLTSKLGGAEVFLSYGDPLHWSSVVGLAMILFLGVMMMVVAGEAVLSLSTNRWQR